MKKKLVARTAPHGRHISKHIHGSINKVISHRHILPPTTPRALLLLDNTATLGRVSNGTGLSAAYLSKIFNGKRVPSLTVAARLASYIGCSIDKLYITLQGITKRKTRKRVLIK